MALKGEQSPPRPARKVHKTPKSKPAPPQKKAAAEFDPAYEGHYGDASRPLEQRRVGNLPNSRARSAVERAEQRAAAMSPEAIRQRKKPQMPGMDLSYHADEELGRQREYAQYRFGEQEAERQRKIDEGYRIADEGEEVIETAEQRQERAAMARMSPVGRGDRERTARMGSMGASPRRNEYGRIQVLNRAGKLVSRTHYATADKFAVPVSFIPEGWTYQWLSEATVGKVNNNTHFLANGWEPVPASRHDGVYMRKGQDGPIIVDDMLLVERPVELTLEARAEELQAAKDLLRTRNEQFQPRLPGARSRRYAGTELRINREYEPMPDDLRPRHVIDDGSHDSL